MRRSIPLSKIKRISVFSKYLMPLCFFIAGLNVVVQWSSSCLSTAYMIAVSWKKRCSECTVGGCCLSESTNQGSSLLEGWLSNKCSRSGRPDKLLDVFCKVVKWFMINQVSGFNQRAPDKETLERSFVMIVFSTVVFSILLRGKFHWLTVVHLPNYCT